MRILATIFLWMLCSATQAQLNNSRDSFWYYINNGKTDTIKAKAWYDLGDSYLDTRTDSAFYFYNKGKGFARSINSPYLEAFAHGYEIVPLNDSGKYKEALQICLNAKELFEKANSHPKDFCRVFINLGSEWQYLGAFQKAADNYLLALKIAEKEGLKKAQSVCLNNLSSLYAEMKDKNKQLEYAQQGKKIALEIKDTGRIFSSSINLGNAYLLHKKFDSAWQELEQLKAINNIKNDAEYTLDILSASSDYYFETKNYTNAINDCKKIIELCQTEPNVEYELVAQKKIAQSYILQEKYNLAEPFALKALQLAKANEVLQEEVTITKLLATICTKLGKQELAIGYYAQHNVLSDSLNILTAHNNSLRLQTEFETEKKDLALLTLNQDNEIKTLQNKRKNWALLGLGGLSLAGLLLGLLYYRKYQNRKALASLEQAKALADERIRIATDMHDDIGGNLSRISFLSYSLQNNSDQTINDKATKISTISNDVMQQMSEIIWALNQQNHTLEEMLYYIRGYASEVVQQAQIEFVFNMPIEIPIINFGWKKNRNTFLLVKEAINNAIKHSQATKITIDTSINNNQLHLRVTDNGKGFDTTLPTHRNGLKNYKKRMDSLQGNYQIKSSSGQGTTVAFEVPL